MMVRNQTPAGGAAWGHTPPPLSSKLRGKNLQERAELRRLNVAVGQLRSEVAVVGVQVKMLTSIEETRPLTPDEKVEAQRLKAESRRLYWELKALIGEYTMTHQERRSR